MPHVQCDANRLFARHRAEFRRQTS
jgi:hypothetical protein